MSSYSKVRIQLCNRYFTLVFFFFFNYCCFFIYIYVYNHAWGPTADGAKRDAVWASLRHRWSWKLKLSDEIGENEQEIRQRMRACVCVCVSPPLSLPLHTLISSCRN